MKFSAALALALLPALASAAPRAWAPTDQPDSVIVAWKPVLDRLSLALEAQRLGLAPAAPKNAVQEALAAQAGGLEDRAWPRWSLSRLQLQSSGAAAVNSALAVLAASPLVESVEPEAIATLAALCSGSLPTIDDQLYTGGFQPGLTATAWPQAVAAYCAGTLQLNANVTVAVLDTGVDAHADLGSVLLAGAGFVGSEPGTDDLHGHGTFVTGLIAADTGNGQGMAGAFFDQSRIRILPVKIMDSCGSGPMANLLSGISYALDAGAKVLNLSLQFPDGTASVALDRALQDARDRGVVVVAASGNISSGNPSTDTAYPASHPLVLSVGALNAAGARASYSKYGKVDLSAPGGDGSGSCNCAPTPSGCTTEVWSLSANHPACGSSNPACAFSDRFEAGPGTSFAAPLVAAAAALLLSQQPGRSPEAVLQRLIQGASATSEGPGYHSTTGWGRLNFYGALVLPGPQAAGSKLKAWNWPNPFSPSGSARCTLAIQGVSEAALRVRLFDAGGDLVKQWELPAGPANAGLQLIPWDGRNGQGVVVANGSYGLVVDGAAGRAVNRVAVLR